MADLKTNLLGFGMNSPVIGASGTVGYGVEYEELADFAKIGGISGKGLTLHGQYGNKGERLWETPSGLINSIGLQNPGVQHFIDVELPEMLELKQKYGTCLLYTSPAFASAGAQDRPLSAGRKRYRPHQHRFGAA